MAEFSSVFEHIKNVLSEDDINSLKQICKKHFSQEQAIPSYVLLDYLDIPVFKKIKLLLEEKINAKLYYLNDFYIYTDNTFSASWHMDTELFTFERAINVWILLSPDSVTDPLCFMADINDKPERYYHSLKIDSDNCMFVNFTNLDSTECSLATIEQERIHTPTIQVGDILTINPKRFHKTNTSEAKHSLVIKFVYEGSNGLLSDSPMPSEFWPEVGIFTNLVNQSTDWNQVLSGLREELKTPESRKALSAGFYPEKIDLYQRMAQTL
ncbi:hypothetical protein PCC8801_1069 [Rippkaea orientalis PCC 8801]|uniref:Phytanoyl-CoA dioxygenase n=1 Tax=Rippkaea orientalis (strain PCC 8801 / RF-1) TaxID=41431 RepID=B7K103_RIPO1|nr:hypothetical protein [Rippkaea orientalis]ACK65144.1 hypothetical protein PCC8801_1069 [Rippkaea orientalis PCC 8801]